MRSRPAPVRGSLRLALAVLVLLAALACRSDPTALEEAPLETFDIDEGADKNIRPEDDVREAPREVVSLIGLLPSDFPEDVWVYEPSSIVDLPAAGSEETFIVFKAREPIAAVAAKLERRLAADGWSGPGLSGGELQTWAKGDRRLGVGLTDRREETDIRIEY